MALVTDNKKSLYGGVSQQPDDTRMVHQVEEMINFFPTLEQGLRLRNPSYPLVIRDINDGTDNITFPSDYRNAFVYTYEKGRASMSDDNYAYIITDKGGLEIIDLNYTVQYNGVDDRYEKVARIYKEGKGIVYQDESAKDYITSFVTENTYSMCAVKDAVFVTNKASVTRFEDKIIDNSYLNRGYIWIKQNDPVYGWSYGANIWIRPKGSNQPAKRIEVPLGNPNTKGTDAIAAELAQRINDLTVDLVATASGSVIEIVTREMGFEIVELEAIDSYGNTASFGWGHRVDYTTDLPKNMNSFTPTTAVGTNDRALIWLEYGDGKWNETHKPEVRTQINPFYMPHIIRKSYNSTTNKIEFVVERYNWDDRLIGDEETNKRPIFLGRRIKDIFFFKNRLGLLSENGLTMSEVGNYTNFWRTSVAALLDSDRIDVEIESLNSVTLEYALPIQDSVMLFSNKYQYRFKGDGILSPSNFEIAQEGSYEMNIDVRPYLMNNRIYFAARRGEKSAIYELFINSGNLRETRATDITAHCPDYVDGHVYNITGSSVNDMLFVISKADYIETDMIINSPIAIVRNTVFVYKFLDSGNQRIQSAWFKWKFNGNLLGGFNIERNFYVLLDRINKLDTAEWLLSDGKWNMDSRWVNGGKWIMSPSSLVHQKQLEYISLEPQGLDKNFLDNYNSIIEGYIDMGRWFYAGGNSSPASVNGYLQMKSMKVMCDKRSVFDITVTDEERDTLRKIPSRFIANRRAMILGRNEGTRLGIDHVSPKGVEISTILIEGNITKRARG